MQERKLTLKTVDEEPQYVNIITPDNITGPLGLWSFPLINLLITLVRAHHLMSKRFRRRTTYEIIRDERGRIVEIVEHEVWQYDW